MEGRTSPIQNATTATSGTENRRVKTDQAIDPSDIAHHLRVAADKYHELARNLIEQMNEAIGALPDPQKASIRQGRESLAKLFDDHASDALRQAKMFDDATTDTLAGVPVILYGTCDPEAARNLAEASRALDSAFAGGNLIRDRLVAGKVDRPAIPGGRDTPASDHELTTAIAAAGVPTDDHAACENPHDDNRGSQQHTPHAPATWIGNEQVNRRVGGEA